MGVVVCDLNNGAGERSVDVVRPLKPIARRLEEAPPDWRRVVEEREGCKSQPPSMKDLVECSSQLKSGQRTTPTLRQQMHYLDNTTATLSQAPNQAHGFTNTPTTRTSNDRQNLSTSGSWVALLAGRAMLPWDATPHDSFSAAREFQYGCWMQDANWAKRRSTIGTWAAEMTIKVAGLFPPKKSSGGCHALLMHDQPFPAPNCKLGQSQPRGERAVHHITSKRDNAADETLSSALELGCTPVDEDVCWGSR
ncbi:hypothetical protein BDW02DRAFT_581466 [Decorospora gaudefroyi]|uniref:Uncharacterized protein n=1 Tax=Decorospora gaudefroyi TaxID=184978 RepID=A0A6A5KBE4_9PLEO|nr:hypothetical protein BDW02DRAFT_581466 [Decorospora gaudefroyi]